MGTGAASRRGIGEQFSRTAVDEARSRGAKSVDLTSRPDREAANRLYQRLGFVIERRVVNRVGSGSLAMRLALR